MDLYYDILLAATPEGCPEPPRSDFYNEMVDQLFTGGVQNLVVVVLHCLLSGVGRSLFPAAGGQQQSQGKDTGDYMSFHGCLLCFSVGGVR